PPAGVDAPAHPPDLPGPAPLRAGPSSFLSPAPQGLRPRGSAGPALDAPSRLCFNPDLPHGLHSWLDRAPPWHRLRTHSPALALRRRLPSPRPARSPILRSASRRLHFLFQPSTPPLVETSPRLA